ncbi:hypothetical protein HGRIS_002803 [Hohenbuehelia grisea]|uniref:Kinetochore protein SPC25 n=1 Tax=Hohenbuehelia grisea TaxID=104357 RepID=A0ABR3JLJ4_9AGAR
MAYTARAPQVDLKVLLGQQNPQIDLKLEPYEISTHNFLEAVSNYKNRAIGIITERRNSQLAEKKKIAERIQAVQTETNQCKVREIELLADLEREKAERKDAEQSVAALRRQLTSLREKCASFDSEIEQYRAVTASLRREKMKERATLDTYASTSHPELSTLETRLACVLEGIEKNQLLIRFTHVDRTRPEREFSFVLDVSGKSYRGSCSALCLSSR